jgi:hypothetical protein
MIPSEQLQSSSTPNPITNLAHIGISEDANPVLGDAPDDTMTIKNVLLMMTILKMKTFRTHPPTY